MRLDADKILYHILLQVQMFEDPDFIFLLDLTENAKCAWVSVFPY